MDVKLYVGNLSYQATEDDLRAAFSEVGTVVSATVITDRETGQSRGFGFVELETEEAAQKAIEQLNNHPILNRPVTVAKAHPRRDRGVGYGQYDRY